MTPVRRFFGALVCLAAVLLALALLEGLCRLALPGGGTSSIVPDPVLGYRRAARARFVEPGENPRPVAVVTNADGWRGPDRPLEKPAGTARVALIGDSYVEATAVEEEKSFRALTEADLARTLGRPVEVCNFGVSGYSPVQYLLVLRDHVLRTRPDVVAMFIFPTNDLEAMTADTAPSRLAPFAATTPDGRLAIDTTFASTPAFMAKRAGLFLRRNLALANIVMERLQRLRLARHGEGFHAGNAVPPYLSPCTASPDPRFVRDLELLELVLAEADRLCREAGARLVVVDVDHDGGTPDDAARLLALDPSFDPFCLEDRIGRFAAARDLPFVGLQRHFYGLTGRTGQAYHWQHWNYAGHAEVARVLAGALAPLLGGAGG